MTFLRECMQKTLDYLRKVNCRKCLRRFIIIIIAAFIYLLCYGVIYRLGDSSSILSKVITVFYYPVNALRVYSDEIYDSTEYLYEMAGGERSILTRAADFGFHRIKQPKNFKVADSYWHNGNKYLIINYYSNGKVRSVIRNGKKAKDCSAIFYYSSGQKIRVVPWIPVNA